MGSAEPPRFATLNMKTLIEKHGYAEGVKKIIERVNMWPADATHPNYPNEKELALEAGKVAADFADHSAKLLNEAGWQIYDRKWIVALTNPITVVSAMSYAEEMVELSETIRNKVTELRNYVAVKPGVSRLKIVIAQLLNLGVSGYAKLEKYKASWTAKILLLAEGVIEVAQALMDLVTEVLNAVADIVKAIAKGMSLITWLVVGYLGYQVYKGFTEKSSVS